MYSDYLWMQALRCANRVGSAVHSGLPHHVIRRGRHVCTGNNTPSHDSLSDDNTGPFIPQSNKYRAEYENAVSLSSRVFKLAGAELRSARLSVSSGFPSATISADKHNALERLISMFRERIVSQVQTDNPQINNVTKYVLTSKSKLFRPKLGLMIARLLSGRSAVIPNSGSVQKSGVTNGSHAESIETSEMERSQAITYDDMSAQDIDRILRLLQSYEIVHVGSLVHDDILDNAMMRRSVPALHVKEGTKMAVLVGDLMLTRACSTVANLGSQLLTIRMAKALENLVKGEITQVEASYNVDNMLCDYLKKTFMKTASLMAECCASIASLLSQDEVTCHKCYLIGLHVGMAFQIYDDLLDYESHSTKLGKPTLNDLSSGLITMPLIMALPESPELGTLLADGTVKSGNVETVLPYINASEAFERSRCAVMMHLAEVSRLLHGVDKNEAAPGRPLSESAQSLLQFVYDTLTRIKG
ncbi:hypothetical protein BaOVIS_013420 [Babesia ovis]|uniref:Polyprenyl synthetase superfamily protein n=1 Tax=Babesia ovis TaxID=5869 RepID=A0A9W5WUI4_BABOV|nr:hypothetical protein BaOVIS_013420 [Babesia ovis]